LQPLPLTIYLSSDGLKLGDDHSLQDDLPESVGFPDKVTVGDAMVAKDFLEEEGQSGSETNVSSHHVGSRMTTATFGAST
jgi:hypothetical protein